MSRRPRRTFTPEQKAEAVRLVHLGLLLASAGQTLLDRGIRARAGRSQLRKRCLELALSVRPTALLAVLAAVGVAHDLVVVHVVLHQGDRGERGADGLVLVQQVDEGDIALTGTVDLALDVRQRGTAAQPVKSETFSDQWHVRVYSHAARSSSRSSPF